MWGSQIVWPSIWDRGCIIYYYWYNASLVVQGCANNPSPGGFLHRIGICLSWACTSFLSEVEGYIAFRNSNSKVWNSIWVEMCSNNHEASNWSSQTTLSENRCFSYAVLHIFFFGIVWNTSLWGRFVIIGPVSHL